LALWVPPIAHHNGGKGVQSIEDLASPDVRIIAVANPRLAPYGEAAVEALKRAHVWDRVNSKIVYAENINMARQYGASGNADAVFTAYPLVMREQGTVLKVAPTLYSPIRQTLGIVAGSAHPDAALRFVEYLLQGNGRVLLKDYGYGVPAR
jgi:molybdate transport system substrate-binding protein